MSNERRSWAIPSLDRGFGSLDRGRGQYDIRVHVAEHGNGAVFFRLVQLVSRSKPHQADLKQDYGKIQQAALEQKKAAFTEKWVLEKLRGTYLSINSMFTGCPNLQEMLGMANKP